MHELVGMAVAVERLLVYCLLASWWGWGDIVGAVCTAASL